MCEERNSALHQVDAMYRSRWYVAGNGCLLLQVFSNQKKLDWGYSVYNDIKQQTLIFKKILSFCLVIVGKGQVLLIKMNNGFALFKYHSKSSFILSTRSIVECIIALNRVYEYPSCCCLKNGRKTKSCCHISCPKQRERAGDTDAVSLIRFGC